MKQLDHMLAILVICAALLGSFAATGGEATTSLGALAFGSWIEAPSSDRAELPGPLRLEPAPLRAESEFDEDSDSDPAAPVALDDGPTVASKATSWETRTSSQVVTLGARSARGPPAA